MSPRLAALLPAFGDTAEPLQNILQQMGMKSVIEVANVHDDVDDFIQASSRWNADADVTRDLRTLWANADNDCECEVNMTRRPKIPQGRQNIPVPESAHTGGGGEVKMHTKTKSNQGPADIQSRKEAAKLRMYADQAWEQSWT